MRELDTFELDSVTGGVTNMQSQPTSGGEMSNETMPVPEDHRLIENKTPPNEDWGYFG